MRRELLGRRGSRRTDICLVELMTTFGDRRDQRDAEVAAPIAEEVGEAGGTIVLIGSQLRIRDDYGERDAIFDTFLSERHSKIW